MIQSINPAVALSSRIVIGSAVGYAACRIFTAINPLSAVLYNSIYHVASEIMTGWHPVFNSICSFGLSVLATNMFFKLTAFEALKVSAITAVASLPVVILVTLLANAILKIAQNYKAATLNA